MLTEVADGVFVRQSAFCRSNAIAVRGDEGVLLVDPGVNGSDLEELADDLDRLGAPVVLGFATHPHWDHVLWHERFGGPRRLATATCVGAAHALRARLRERVAELAPGVTLSLVGRITPLATDSSTLPWTGPEVRVVEHQAHAPGHAALLVRERGVLIAGDMLSDVEIPLFDPEGDDPAGDYALALEELAAVCEQGVATLVPGHGSVAAGAAIGARIEADRAYVRALRKGADPRDPRVGPGATYGADWLPEAHERNSGLARPQ
jgi:glyoxylase-like metal-dependent hydrolase (beta-lactamase superfamily II)